MSRKRKVSIEDVARRAKVSITTVSRVVNKVPTVSRKNVIAVEEAIAHLKYKPDINAQRLASGVSDAVGLVMPGYPGIFHSFYAIELIRGVGHACEILQMDMVFHITNGMNPLNHHSVGGLIFADIIENRSQIEDCLAAGVPCIVINNIVNDLDVNYIGIDNFVGGQVAAEYLSELGHNRIATITGSFTTQAGKGRYDGFCDYLSRKNIPLPDELVVEGDFSRRSARAGAEKLMALDQRPTAIFVGSDDMALEAIAVVIEKGLRVPDDVSVLGFDDNPASIYGPVALTTVKQPLFEMASDAVKYLSNIIHGKKKSPVQKVMSPHLVVRESCRPIQN